MTGIDLRNPYVRLGWAATKVATDLAGRDLLGAALDVVQRILPDDGDDFKIRVLERSAELLEERMAQLYGEVNDLSAKVEALRDAQRYFESGEEAA
jgi:hypothetical protein